MSAAFEKPDRSGSPAAYRLEDSVGHLLRRAHQRHAALFQTHGGALGLTPTQFAALLRLSELGRATQNALGRAVAVDSATIQGVVQRLIARGLVTTSRDPMDRRTVVLALTDQGGVVLDEARTCAANTNAALLAELNVEERATLVNLLRRVSDGT